MALTIFSLVGNDLGSSVSSVRITISEGSYPKRSILVPRSATCMRERINVGRACLTADELLNVTNVIYATFKLRACTNVIDPDLSFHQPYHHHAPSLHCSSSPTMLSSYHYLNQSNQSATHTPRFFASAWTDTYRRNIQSTVAPPDRIEDRPFAVRSSVDGLAQIADIVVHKAVGLIRTFLQAEYIQLHYPSQCSPSNIGMVVDMVVDVKDMARTLVDRCPEGEVQLEDCTPPDTYHRQFPIKSDTATHCLGEP